MLPAAVIPPDHIAREVNERIHAKSRDFMLAPDSRPPFVCECGCFGRAALTLAEYEALAGPVLAPGHPVRTRPPVRLANRISAALPRRAAELRRLAGRAYQRSPGARAR